MPNITPHLIKIKNQTNLELETSAILNLNPCDGDGGDGGQKESDGKEPGKEMKVGKEKKLARTDKRADIEFECRTSIAVSARGPRRLYN